MRRWRNIALTFLLAFSAIGVNAVAPKPAAALSCDPGYTYTSFDRIFEFKVKPNADGITYGLALRMIGAGCYKWTGTASTSDSEPFPGSQWVGTVGINPAYSTNSIATAYWGPYYADAGSSSWFKFKAYWRDAHTYFYGYPYIVANLYSTGTWSFSGSWSGLQGCGWAGCTFYTPKVYTLSSYPYEQYVSGGGGGGGGF